MAEEEKEGVGYVRREGKGKREGMRVGAISEPMRGHKVNRGKKKKKVVGGGVEGKRRRNEGSCDKQKGGRREVGERERKGSGKTRERVRKFNLRKDGDEVKGPKINREMRECRGRVI